MEHLKGMKKLISLALASAMAVAATLIGLPASPASAAPSVSSVVEVVGNFPVSASSEIRGTLNCPAGYRLVGAGGGHGGAITVFTALTPTADNTGATMVAKLIELAPDPNQNRVHLEIMCAPADQFADVITVKTNDHRARPGIFSQGISRCPAGYFAFGGGGYFSAGAFDVQGAASSNSTNSPSADGTAWTFAGVAPPGVRTALVTITQCAPRTGHDFLVQFGNVSTNGNDETVSFVDCPSGYRAIAGGFYASNPDGSVATPASAEDSSPVGGRWFVLGFTPPNTKLVALAQCLR
jgi:hypothetical protein